MKSKQALRIDRKHRREVLNALSLMTQLGLTMAVCVFIGVAGGWFLDGRLGTSPWFLLGLTVLGVVAALKSMYDMVMKNMGNMANIEKEDGKA